MIDIVNDAELGEDDLAWLQLHLEKLESVSGIANAGDVCINIIDETAMQALNRDYRNIDSTTDVLSFPAAGDGFPQPEPILGDIALCLQVIKQNAADQGDEFRTELLWAVVHGLLHLLGWNHETDETYIAMNRKTIDILTQCGVEVNDVG
jgi:probable rRNA maturation factor